MLYDGGICGACGLLSIFAQKAASQRSSFSWDFPCGFLHYAAPERMGIQIAQSAQSIVNIVDDEIALVVGEPFPLPRAKVLVCLVFQDNVRRCRVEFHSQGNGGIHVVFNKGVVC